MGQITQNASFDDFDVTHRYAQVGQVRLHYVDAGSGPLVVLLHGFPEFWYGWRHQIPALVKAGFRVVAPDLRGYNLSDKPNGVRAYRVPALVEDVAGLIRTCGRESATVVGHDWGGLVAWAFAMHHPELLDRLVVLDSPHPKNMARALRTWKQLRKSWYMFFFQLPWLPEIAARHRRFARLLDGFRDDPLIGGVFDDRDLASYASAFAQPGAITSMIHYYRALLRSGVGVTRRRIEAPTLVIWGERDRYLGRELAEPDPGLVRDARVEFIEASHWVQHEQPERVNALLIAFLSEKAAG